VNATPRHIIPGNGPLPIVQEGEWNPGLAWTVSDNLALTVASRYPGVET